MFFWEIIIILNLNYVQLPTNGSSPPWRATSRPGAPPSASWSTAPASSSSAAWSSTESTPTSSTSCRPAGGSGRGSSRSRQSPHTLPAPGWGTASRSSETKSTCSEALPMTARIPRITFPGRFSIYTVSFNNRITFKIQTSDHLFWPFVALFQS